MSALQFQRREQYLTSLQMLGWLFITPYFFNAQQQPKTNVPQPFAFVSFSKHICFFACCCALETHCDMFCECGQFIFQMLWVGQAILFNVIIYQHMIAHRPKSIKVTRKVPFLGNVCLHVRLNVFMALAGQKSQAKWAFTICM